MYKSLLLQLQSQTKTLLCHEPTKTLIIIIIIHIIYTHFNIGENINVVI